MRLLPLDQVDAAGGAGGAVGVHQALDPGAALGLLAVVGLVGGSARAQPLAVGERRGAFALVDDVDEVGIDQLGDLRLGPRLGGVGALVGGEELGVLEA